MKYDVHASHIRWTGNTGQGPTSYCGYVRDWDIAVPGKPAVSCSNDPLLGELRQDEPEDLLLSALSSCHMLWYMHLAPNAGITVTATDDTPEGTGEISASGAGSFVSALLRPMVTVKPGADLERAAASHHEIHDACFIARSVKFSAEIDPQFVIEPVE